MTVAARWARRNLFASAFDGVLSIAAISLGLWTLATAVSWSVSEAQWHVVTDSLRVLMVGIYPADQTWRAWGAAFLLSAVLGGTLGLPFPWRPLSARGAAGTALAAGVITGAAFNYGAGSAALVAFPALCWAGATPIPRLGRWLAPAWVAAIAAAFVVLAGPGLDEWGGLMLSVMLTIVASLATLPLGILLAFGRRSELPSVRICCTAYIEVTRSVPLILVVYWIWISVPLLAPDHPVSGLVRGMAGYAAFYSAYVAEYIRSGLQAIPRGQVEAARSLGMSGLSLNAEVVLPQALRVVLPALVGNVLDIFNGATLVFIIGLTDFLRAGQMILADPRYSDRTYEVYAFMFVVYFAIGSAITYAARRLEAHLSRGARR